MKILVADDDTFTRRFLTRTLEGWGHRVEAAADGADAWNEFCRDPADLVITDWLMPHVDGLELCQQIRQEAESYTYLILVTSNTKDAGGLVRAFDAGVDDFVAKPFNVEELEVRIRAGERVINLHRTNAQQLDKSLRVNQAVTAANDRLRREIDRWSDNSTAAAEEDPARQLLALRQDVKELLIKLGSWFHELDLTAFGVDQGIDDDDDLD